jgi:hypothetical protein
MSVRRAVLGAGVLTAALAAHLVAAPDAHAARGAPVLWAGLVALCALVGPRRRWRARGLLHSASLAGGLQIGAHVAMSAAPWAFGLSAHHAAGLMVDPRAIVPHLAAALMLAVVLNVLDRALGAARHIVNAIARLLRAPDRPTGRPCGHRPPSRRRVPRGLASGSFASRGPPPVHV